MCRPETHRYISVVSVIHPARQDSPLWPDYRPPHCGRYGFLAQTGGSVGGSGGKRGGGTLAGGGFSGSGTFAGGGFSGRAL
jgi:hypothetical protein